MDQLLQNIRDWLRPSTYKCDSDLEHHLEATYP